jgi:hypothetical protein
MTYVINKYSGAILVSIPDRTLNTTATSIKLPGRDLPRYGEPIVENLVWMLENFAGASPPAQAMQGQIWYDTQSDAIRVYNGSTWTGTGKVSYGSTAPDSPENGQLWYHSAKKQLWAWDTSQWVLVGPPGSIISDDGIVPLTNRSSMDTTQVQDTLGGLHHILRMNISGTTVAIVSKDPEFTPTPLISGFTTISPGITLNTSVSNNKFRGTATQADSATTANNLAGVAASSFMRRDQTNVPTTNNSFNLGSVGARYATMFATTFDGTATSALYADVAERYHADTVLDAGTVVVLGGVNEITASDQTASDQVLGVISTAPAVCMNSQAGGDDTHPYVALLGRCPVKVQGVVRKGDRLQSSSTPGVAEKWDPASGILTILGRCLETKTHADVALVEAVVGVK